MTAVDRLGFHVRLKTAEGMCGARIAFLRQVSRNLRSLLTRRHVCESSAHVAPTVLVW